MLSLRTWFVLVLGITALVDANVIHTRDTCEYNGSKCPVYTVLSQGEGYEHREYEPASWIGTNETVREYTRNVSRMMYFRLRNYIEHRTLGMGVPVLTERGNPNINGSTTYTKYFYLEDQNSLEHGSENGVFRYYSARMRVFVRTYGGKPTYQQKEDELMKLKASIADSSLYNHEKAYFAGFNPPWVMNNRRNEVWIESIV
ncbi:heme-binding protein 2-like isoform X2 [Ylistrum balloti]|nr:heme-binding protein 2-like isoform X2 [Ylistrum balloti]